MFLTFVDVHVIGMRTESGLLDHLNRIQPATMEKGRFTSLAVKGEDCTQYAVYVV